MHVHEVDGATPTSDASGAVKKNHWRFIMKKFFKDESGATAIEYALIAAAMGLALVTAMPTLGNVISNKFTAIGTNITNGK